MIHPSAVIDPKAIIGDECHIGPYCIIGPNVRLGHHNHLHSHVVLDGHLTLGDHNEIFPFASIGLKTQDLKWKGGLTHTAIGNYNTFREYVTIHSATSDGEVTRVGNHNHILAYCHLAHNVELGNHIIMSNLATLAGHVIVQDYAVLGGMAGIHQFCRIGSHAIVGGCSKVVQDIAPYTLVDGNPGSTRGLNKVGLQRHGITPEAQSALKKAYRILFRERLPQAQALERIQSECAPLPEIQHLLHFVQTTQRGLCPALKTAAPREENTP